MVAGAVRCGAPLGVAGSEEERGLDLDFAIETAAWGEAGASQLEYLEGHQGEWKVGLERLLRVCDGKLATVRKLTGPERDQVVADFEQERARLVTALRRFVPEPEAGPQPQGDTGPAGPVQLEASWSHGMVVLWAAGRRAAAEDEEAVMARLAAIGAPGSGWESHQAVKVPTVGPAPARAIRIGDALGWLVYLGAGERPEEVGSSLIWLGRVAAWAVQLVARGAIAPTLATAGGTGKRPGGKGGYAICWVPALVDRAQLERLARALPGPVTALDQSEARTLTLAVLTAAVDAIATGAAQRLEFPAPPPVVRTAADVAESVVTRLDGSVFEAPADLAGALSGRLGEWARALLAPVDARLTVQLDPPDRDGAWLLTVLGPGHDGRPVPLGVALVDGRSKRHLADEALRLERLLPALKRPGSHQRGQVVLSQEEAWEVMTLTGPVLADAGFEVRVPALSRRRPSPKLVLTADPVDPSVVGAHQLVQVRWSALFDDVELTAEDIRRLATEARPLIRSRGKWVEIDRVDLEAAAAALAEQAGRTRLTGADVLRHAIGIESSALAGGVEVRGSGWATDLLNRASAVTAEDGATPDRFVGTLRSYQTEALAWLGFLDSVELGGCLALDMGLGKTPTVLAHLARTTGSGPALVIAPTAVVGNWAAEMGKFTPDLRLVIHHGASRSSAEELAAEVARADVVITTYGTAVRDVEALALVPWSRLVLDEAQAIKNPASETAQQLRRIPARSRFALTGTPVENGLGDLWAILDFVNPTLVGPRSAFVSRLSATGEAGGQAEDALRALNGILVFRRTKAEPEVAAELPDKIDELDHCTMTTEQIGLYQAVLDRLVGAAEDERNRGDVLAAITALKQICNHPTAYQDDDRPLAGRSGKLARLEEIVEVVFAAGEKVLVFTHFAEWGKRLAAHLTERTGSPVSCYRGELARTARDKMVEEFQNREGPAALVLSLKAGGTGLNLTAANHVVLYDRWWNPAVEDQARDRAWRIGQQHTVISHRLVCPGTVDERVEEVVEGKRHVADLVLPKSSSLSDLDPGQLQLALGLRPETLLSPEDDPASDEEAAA